MPVEQLATADEVTAIWSGFAKIPAPAQQALINTSSKKIIGFVRRPGFAPVMRDELYDGTNTSTLWLKMRPIITINQITVNGEVIDNSDGLAWTVNTKTGQLVRGHTLGLIPNQGDPRFHRWWPRGTQNIEVQYWAGFAAVPDDVKMAIAFYCQFLRAQLAAPGVFISESIGDYSYTIDRAATKFGIPISVLDLILEYVQDDGPL